VVRPSDERCARQGRPMERWPMCGVTWPHGVPSRHSPPLWTASAVVGCRWTVADFGSASDRPSRCWRFCRGWWHGLVHLKLVAMLMWWRSWSSKENREKGRNCKEKLVSPKSHLNHNSSLTFLEILLGGFGSTGVSLASPEPRLLENFFRFRFSAAKAPKCK
jgi:hypothetical protein